MRRLAVMPLALLLGCWDFAALSTDGGYVPPDLSPPPDIACAKTPNNLREDCTKDGDVNNNCLVGCEDPDCADSARCYVSKGYLSYGGVNLSSCQVAQKSLFQNLTTPANCNGSCACNSTTSCTTNLHAFNNQNDCQNVQNEIVAAKVAVPSGPAMCTTVAGAMGYYYSLDKPAAGGQCTAKNATVNLTPNWGTTSMLCDQSASGLSTFSAMKTNGITCLVFSGTDTGVCASTKLYTKGTVYYTSTNGTSTCNCSCAASGGCTIGNGEVELTDGAMCKGGNQNLTEIKTVDKAGCVMAVDGNKAAVTAVGLATKIANPSCNPAGAVSGTFTETGGTTLCCM